MPDTAILYCSGLNPTLLQSLRCGFPFMAWPAQRLEIIVLIRTAMCFRGDVVNH